MRVFVTGATGMVGGGAARALLAHGHSVVGLARSADAADRLRAIGIEPQPGGLEDANALQLGAAEADAVVHAAFPRDAYERLDDAIALERKAIDVLVNTVQGTPTRLLYTSGIGVVGEVDINDDTPARTPASMQWRRDLELVVAGAGGLVLRPVLVYGRGSGDILVSLIRRAAERGEVLYPAPGDNTLATIHVDDLGEAFVLALQRAPDGTVLNLAAGHVTLRDLAESIGRLIGRPDRVRGVPLSEADEVVPYARWLSGSTRVVADRARALLQWAPHQPGLVEDVERGSYEATASAASSTHWNDA